MRSCARRILLAATISIALVIFCVLLTLAILVRISLVPGMARSFSSVPVARKSSQTFFSDGLVLLAARLVIDGFEQRRVVGARKALQRRFELHDLAALDLVHVAVVDRVDRQRHLRHRHRRVLLLLHHLGDALAALELAPRRLVEIGRELRERREFAILRERQADTAAELLDDLGLRRAADARHRDAGVHGRTDAGVEQIGLEEDLAVGDRDHVGRHERGHVAGLRLDDRQPGQRAGLALDLALG